MFQNMHYGTTSFCGLSALKLRASACSAIVTCALSMHVTARLRVMHMLLALF